MADHFRRGRLAFFRPSPACLLLCACISAAVLVSVGAPAQARARRLSPVYGRIQGINPVAHDVSVRTPPNRRTRGRRILITGGAGFIGSHLVDRLLQMGHMVIVADSLFTGRKSNLAAHFSNPRFEFIRHDVTEPLHVEVDQIYHLACPASPIHYKYNPVKTLKTSFLGTYNMLGLAKRTHARFLITSTSEVYGDPLMHPQVEEYWGNVNPIGERSCYDEGKRVAETLTMDYSRQNGVDVRIARIFNTYGPRMALNDGRVVSNFVGQALRGEQLTVQGNGNQTRSFCYVSDQVDGLIKLMNTESVVGPVNIGNPTEFTIRELADIVKEVVRPNVDIVYTPTTPDDPKQRKPDISKAKRVLGWEPLVELRDGLRHMSKDFEKRGPTLLIDDWRDHLLYPPKNLMFQRRRRRA